MKVGKECDCGWGTKLSNRFKEVARDEYNPRKLLAAPVLQVIGHIRLIMINFVDIRPYVASKKPKIKSWNDPLSHNHDPSKYIKHFSAVV